MDVRFENLAEDCEAKVSAERSGGFCIDCGSEVESFDGLDACLFCNTQSVPCAWSDQVNVSVNWQELRVLVIWAENWARAHADSTPTMRRTVYRIAQRLRGQHPERGPLTLAEELGDLAGEYRLQVNDPRLRQDIAEQTGREVDIVRREPERNG